MLAGVVNEEYTLTLLSVTTTYTNVTQSSTQWLGQKLCLDMTHVVGGRKNLFGPPIRMVRLRTPLSSRVAPGVIADTTVSVHYSITIMDYD